MTGQDPNSLMVIFKEPMMRQFATAMEKNAVTRFRVYQVGDPDIQNDMFLFFFWKNSRDPIKRLLGSGV